MRRRTTYAVLCAVCAVLALLAAAAGAVLALAFGPDDAITSRPTAVSAPGAAVIAEQLRIDADSLPTPKGVGTLTIDVDPVGPRSIFVGQAPQSDLDAFFRGVPYDVVVSLEPGGQAQLRSVPGTVLPQDPGDQSFWTRSASGAAGEVVSFDTDTSESTSLVIMNADPMNGVDVDLSVTYTVVGVWRAALILLGSALLLGLLALLLCWRSRAAGKRARAAAAAAPVVATGPPTAPDVLPGASPHAPAAPTATVRPLAPPVSPPPPPAPHATLPSTPPPSPPAAPPPGDEGSSDPTP